MIEMPSNPSDPIRVEVLANCGTSNVIYFDKDLKEVITTPNKPQHDIGSSYAARYIVSWNQRQRKWTGRPIHRQAEMPPAMSGQVRLEPFSRVNGTFRKLVAYSTAHFGCRWIQVTVAVVESLEA